MIYPIEPKMNVEEMGNYSNAEVLRYSKDCLGVDNVVLQKDIEDMTFCYNYALNDNLIEACDDGYEILEAEYEQIPISEVKRWDIVSYHKLDELDDDGNEVITMPDMWNCKHFGKVLRCDGTIKGTYIRSKWGRTGIFDTPLDLVCNHYGNAVLFWRKKKLANI